MKNHDLHLLSRLSDYTLKSVLIRVSLVSLTGWLFLFTASRFAGDGQVELTLLKYLRTILIFNIISEGNVLFDHIAERYLPIPEKISLRIILHAVVSLLLGAVLLAAVVLTGSEPLFFSNPMMQMMILFGLIFTFILILISVTLRIIDQWISSVRQLEEMKNLKLASDYSSLQAQLNPHFLFNNLSVLKSMITYEPESAIQFTQNFTDVYRYVLQSKDKSTVKVSEELGFIGAYTALHKERMGSALIVETDISNAAINREIPPLALQLLIENALKHNIALKDSPLHIVI
ncbi:histidine kinase, partial [Lentimicrobium sp.]